MAKFAPPPVRTEIVGKQDSPTYPWERWFQAITDFLTAPTIPRNTPASSTATGVPDSITYDTNFIYICVAKNQWKRVALSSF
jgi:hypothetical protein